jgi:hypothetical protein
MTDFIKDQLQLTNFLHQHPEIPKDKYIVAGNKIGEVTLISEEEAKNLECGLFFISQIVHCRKPEMAIRIAKLLNEEYLKSLECKTCHGDQYLQPCTECGKGVIKNILKP